MIHVGQVLVQGLETQFEGGVRAHNLVAGVNGAKRNVDKN